VTATNARIALLGLGAAAREIHWPACRELAGLQVVAGADPDPEAQKLFSQQAPGLECYDSAAALFDAHDPDWVIVGAAPSAHAELCELAFARGAHVFCEKPLAADVAGADALIAAAKRAGRTLAVNHEFPHMPIFQAAAAAIGGPEMGELIFLQVWEHLDELHESQPGWRAEGRTLREFGTHVVDLAVRFFGSFPARVFCSMPRAHADAPPGSDLIDLLVLEFPDGRAASIVLDRICHGEHRYLEMRLDGERASLRTSIGGRAGLSLKLAPRSRKPVARLDWAAGGQAWLERGDERSVLARNPGGIFAHATARHLEQTLAAVASGEAPPCPAHFARGIAVVVEAAYASAESGQRVDLPADPTSPEARA
jgi:predicted dehydrogenase